MHSRPRKGPHLAGRATATTVVAAALVAFALTHGNRVPTAVHVRDAAPVRDAPTNFVRDKAAPSTADPFTTPLEAAVGKRAGVISAAALDLRTGSLYEYRPGVEAVTASVVKVEILGTLLAQAQAKGQALTSSELSLATAMIEMSDNNAATALWAEVGGAAAVSAFDRSMGMASTTPNLYWGLTTTTAADQVALLEHLVEPNRVLSGASRDYILQLMEHVMPYETWGVSARATPGTTVALKNGWLPVGRSWEVNSIGWVDGSGRDYLIAVLTSGSPTEAYGIASISMIAGAAWASLGPSS